MKEKLFALLGIFGGAISGLFGGWDSALITLITFMCIDYMTGFIVAAVFKNSPKTESGALQSNLGFKGLCKKGMILLIVLIAVRLDIVIGTSYIRDCVCIGFIANELVSIIENAGLMGVPIPAVITKAIDILKSKSEGEKDNESNRI